MRFYVESNIGKDLIICDARQEGRAAKKAFITFNNDRDVVTAHKVCDFLNETHEKSDNKATQKNSVDNS